MKKRVIKKKVSRERKGYLLCFKRSASQGDHLSERQARSWIGTVCACYAVSVLTAAQIETVG